MPKKKPVKNRSSRKPPARKIKVAVGDSTHQILAKQLDMIRQVASGMRKGMAYYEILKLVFRSISQAVKLDRLSLYIVDEKEQTIARDIVMDSHSHFETGHHARTALKTLGGDVFSDVVFKKKETVVTTKGVGEFQLAVTVPVEASEHVKGVMVAERRAGAKPFTQEEVGTLHDLATQTAFILENIHLHYQLVQIAFKDELTGQYNHRFFIKRLREEVDRSTRYQHAFTLLFVGIDKFTAFNDRYGYAMGDRILKELGEYLRKTLRACDLVARMGGDRFGIILPETSLPGVAVVAEKIRKAVESFEFTDDPGLKEIRVRFTVSQGAVEFPTHGLMLEQILENTYKALDEAKSKGANQTCISTAKTSEAH